MFGGDILSTQTVLAVVFIGIIATAVGDLWNLLLLRLRVIPVLGWNYVGRWVLGFGSGQIYAPDLGAQPTRRGEITVGWVFHYAVGILYGAIYVLALKFLWVEPTVLNGIVVGLVTLAAPFLIMKPLWGGGVCGLRSPTWPKDMSLTTSGHVVFGLGLYLAVRFYGALLG